MAGALELSDGTTTVSMMNASGLYIKRDAYQQRAGSYDSETGEILDVVDVIPCSWMESDDDTRASTIQNLYRLARKTNRYKRLRLAEDFVWLKMQTHSETNARYSIVTQIYVDQLAGRHYGPQMKVDVVITVVREAAAWAIQPDGTPLSISGGGTIYQEQTASFDNYVEITAAEADGDAPLLARIEISPGGTPAPQKFWVLRMNDPSSSELDKFSPLFQAGDELDNTGSQAADTAAPNDVRLELTSTTTLRWSLDSNRPLSLYHGEYHVYAVAGEAGTGSATIQFEHGAGYIQSDAVTVKDTSTSARKLHYLGRHSIPGGTYNPLLADPSGYDLKLNVAIAGTATVFFFALWLLKYDDERAFQTLDNIKISSLNKIVLDGIQEMAYEKSLSDTFDQKSTGAMEPNGQYIQLVPGEINRLYFTWVDSGGEVVTFSQPVSVSVQLVPRFMALRGAV